MKNAVVLGVNGQDGSYLADILIDHGYRVIGIGLQKSSRHVKNNNNYEYLSQDIKDSAAVSLILKKYRPDEIYHLAAIHGAAGFQYENVWDDVLDVNLKSLNAILEYARNENPAVRIAYASSAKVFGNKLVGNISIADKHHSDCLYSISKNAASDLINYYYTRHNIFGSVAYFFNHDSVRRNKKYFIPTIVAILANAIKNNNYIDEIETLDFYCNWGCAYEYMNMFMKILSLPERHELIIASDKTWYGREFVGELFKRHSLNYKDHITERNKSRLSKPYTVLIKETNKLLGLFPVKDIFSVCDDILEEFL
jgi:GDPmannose 4,6-dehydratase